MGFLVILVIGFIAGMVYRQSTQSGSMRPVIIFTVAGLLAGLMVGSLRVVPAGYVGVVDLFGQVAPQPLASGISVVNPLAKVVAMSTRTLEDKETMTVPSKEGLNVSLDVSVLYRLDPAKAVDVYKTVGTEYQNVILLPQYRAAARGVTVSHEAKALYTSERELLAQGINDSLRNLIGDRGVIVERVLLRAISLPGTVSAAIEQKLKAEQDAERMKFVLQREAQEAERKRVEAQGIRDAQTIINESLTDQYLHYLWINTLNQNPNVVYVATEANMPLFRASREPEKKPINNKEK